jgi:branched-chain amino acid transport system permease protein
MGYFSTVISSFFGSLLAGVSLHGVFSMAGIFFLGIPVVGKVSAYTLAIAQKSGIPPEYAFLLAIIASLLVGLLFAYLFVKVSPDSFAVLGLASLLATEALFKSWDTLTNGILGISGIKRPEMLTSLDSLMACYFVTVILFLILEYVLLKTWIGRAVRAYKQDKNALDALGVSSLRLGQGLIVFSALVYGIVGFLLAWRVQFISPSIQGIPALIEILTIAILAFKPRVSAIIIATLFVALFPELLRFLALPSTVLGYARLLLYSVALLILIYKLSPRLASNNRKV